MKKQSVIVVVAGAIFALTTSVVHAQSNKDNTCLEQSKNKQENLTSMDYITIMKQVGWKPRKDGKFQGDYEGFEEVFIKMLHNPNYFKQLEINGKYYCSKDHDLNFYTYNKYYTPINRNTWDYYCRVLYNLMDIDGVFN